MTNYKYDQNMYQELLKDFKDQPNEPFLYDPNVNLGKSVVISLDDLLKKTLPIEKILHVEKNNTL